MCDCDRGGLSHSLGLLVLYPEEHSKGNAVLQRLDVVPSWVRYVILSPVIISYKSPLFLTLVINKFCKSSKIKTFIIYKYNQRKAFQHTLHFFPI